MDLHLVSLFSYVHAPFFSTIERTHMRHPIYRTLMPKTRLCQTQNTEEVNVHGLNGSIDDVERNVKVGGKPHSRNSVAFRSESPLPKGASFSHEDHILSCMTRILTYQSI